MSVAPEHPSVRGPRAPIALQLLALVAAVVALLAGLWLFASPVSRTVADATGLPAYWSSIAFAVIWFVLASIVLGKLRKSRPELGIALRVGFGLTVAVVGGVFAWTSLMDDKASDDVSFLDDATTVSQPGPPPASSGGTAGTPVEPERRRTAILSSGTFSGIDHTAEGRARVVELPSGERRVVFTEFDVERAPDLRVYMAVDEVTGDIGEYRELGKLKGNVGNQYYELPKGLDLQRYRHVVVWCKAFDVGVAQASLESQ